ncbi:MAG: DUF2842 domain-containing protein, partial [Sphingorhabdus sp.]
DNIMNKPLKQPTWRKPAGMLAILLIILVWSVLIVSASDFIGQLHILVQSVIYLVAGIIWIAPMRPLLIWMETGSFRAPPTT